MTYEISCCCLIKLSLLIINSIMSAILIPTVIYNSYVHKKTQRMINDAELEVKKYLTEVEKSF